MLIVPSVFAADQEVENLLAKMRNAYSTVKSAKYTMVVTFRKPPLHCTNYFVGVLELFRPVTATQPS